MHYKLIVWDDCYRRCPGCVNKTLDPSDVTLLSSLDDLSTRLQLFDHITITGGEPSLYPLKLLSIITYLRTENPTVKLYCYLSSLSKNLIPSLYLLDGITYTLHYPQTIFDPSDYEHLTKILPNITYRNPSFSSRLMIDTRLTHFHPDHFAYSNWSSIQYLEWKPDGDCITNDIILKLSKEALDAL